MPAIASGLIIEVAWQDRAERFLGFEPDAYIITQDPTLPASWLKSTTSQSGPYAGSAYADASNVGHLIPFTTGSWDEDTLSNYPEPNDLVLRIVSTGSLYDSGEYAYRNLSETDNQHVGMDDLRWLHRPEDPFTIGGSTGSKTICSVYSSAHHRYIVSYLLAGNQFKFRYKSGSGGAWSSDIDVLVPRERMPQQSGVSAMVEMPDGTILFFYKVDAATFATSTFDIDMLLSNDGGLTFSHVKQGIILDLYGELKNIAHFCVASSGDWIRLDFFIVLSSGAGVVSAVSADGGATWRFTGSDQGDGLDVSGTDSYAPNSLFDTCAGDDNGTFIRTRIGTVTSSSPTRDCHVEIAVRDADWSEMSWSAGAAAVKVVPDYVEGVWLAGGSGRVFMLFLAETGASTNLWRFESGSYIISNGRLTEGRNSTMTVREGYSNWGSDDWVNWTGVQRWTPKLGHLTYVGDRLAFFTSMFDRPSGTVVSNIKGLCSMWWGGPAKRPLRLDINTHTNYVGKIFTRSWLSALGPPVGTGSSSSTPWSEINAGSFSKSIQVDGFVLKANAGAITPGQVQVFNDMSLTSPTTHNIADNGFVQFSTAGVGASNVDTRPSLTTGSLSSPSWGLYIQSGSQHAGLTLQVAVHIFADESFVLYNAGTLDTMYTSPANALAGIQSGTEYDFRVGLGDAYAAGEISTPMRHYVNVHYGPAHTKGVWRSTGKLQVSPSTNTILNQRVLFGVAATTLVGSHARFTEFAYNRFNNRNLLDQDNPNNMRGFDCIPFDQLLMQNVMARWGGAGGFIGDQFTVPIEYQHASSNLLTPSPASVWRSTSATTQTVSFDANGQANEFVRRMNHSAAAVFNTNSRYAILEYSAAPTFTNLTTITLDGLRAVVNVKSDSIVSGNQVEIEGADVSSWRDGEVSGWYANTGPGTSIVKIDTNHSDTISFSGLTQALSGYGIAAGSTLYLWSGTIVSEFIDFPKGVRVMSGGVVDRDTPRFMRLTIPADTVQGSPPEGYWFLGRLQAGMTLPISVPMSWESSDNEEGNVSVYTANSGVRRAYKSGDPRRTIAATSAGDVDRWRTAFRSVVKNITGYSQHPIVLCTDSRSPNLHSIFCRLSSSTEFANVGWKYNDSRGRWEKVGDLKMTFEEEV